MMSLSSLQLDAFLAVARAGSFSEAAARLGITQSALSQRVLNLESELERTLFLRESAGTRLSEDGEALLVYARAKEAMEAEFLAGLGSGLGKGAPSGLVRVAAFSTVARALVLPRLGALGRKHQGLRFELLTRELREMPTLLRNGRVDMALSLEALDRAGFESRLVGWEENVLVQSSRYASAEVYLDHDEEDATTREFWRLQRKGPSAYARAYFDEAYALLDAVAEGLGRAVLPRRWLRGARGVEAVAGLKPLRQPVYLIRPERAYRPRAQELVAEEIAGAFADS